MRKELVMTLILLGVIALGGIVWAKKQSSSVTVPSTAVGNDSSPEAPQVSAPGRVEPISEEIALGAEISGRLKAVLVEEGDRVSRGQAVAILEDADYRARVDSAEALLLQKEAELRRIVNGSRDQERREALAASREAEAFRENMRTEWERRQGLFRTGDIAREEVERAERQYQVARARFEASVERHALVDAQAREEDVARAEADISLARARIAESQAMLEKTVIRSPLDGIVLRKHLRTGESVSSATTGAAQSIVTLADISHLRVRADIDEVDVGQIQVGQRAYVTADAYGEKQFWGRVVRVGQVLGKKNIRTNEPVEKVDTKILETLIDLDPGSDLKIGLRVNTFLLLK